MKRYIIPAGIALLVLASMAGAQGYSFYNNLQAGSSGQDVVNLQTWLMQNGYDIPAVSSGAANKGYFGSQTKSALIRYQAFLGLPAYGFFGPLTRAKLNGNGNDYRGGSLRVTSPNGGETWQKGTTQSITWTGAQGFLNQTADIRLEFPIPPCADPAINPIIRCMIAVRAPLIIARGVNLNNGYYPWNVGTVTDLSNTGTTITDGQYKVSICPTNGSQCDSSDNYFNINSNSSTGSAPVINGIDAPTTLSVNQTGTWAIRATDPQNGTLSYSVLWGDEPGYAVTGGTMSVPAMMQTTTFTHSYANAGNYTVTFTVRNSYGLQVQTSSTIQVTGSNNTAGPLRIISPNGGEIWQKGTTQNITWTSPAYFRATYANLQLVPYRDCSQVCTAIYIMPYTIASNISINQNSYSWNVGTVTLGNDGMNPVVPNGQYTIQICEVSSNNCESSDRPFTITSDSTSNLPDINIISPNGGERILWGQNQTMSVNITGDPARIGNLINLYLVDSANRQTSISSITNVSTGIKTATVMIPPVQYGYYRLYATLSQNGQIQAYDYSDNQFYVSSPCPAGYSCVPN